MTTEQAAQYLGYGSVEHLEKNDISDRSEWWELIKKLTDADEPELNLHLVSGISLEELKRLKEVYKERKESNGKATAYKEAADDEIREGVIDHLLALINYR